MSGLGHCGWKVRSNIPLMMWMERGEVLFGKTSLKKESEKEFRSGKRHLVKGKTRKKDAQWMLDDGIEKI